ncbi:hypothetical protein CROQUDRAFT_95381 [Cronartium quercuum f. sp. fusiforme G11]|uniref:Uncharacterized protein n=1 Tax=Cronartium quercuum f. sp. fusiforme G11 TaxID=708437 RepID=A0A9P6NIB9_9BASI|nr:hypothetical protein CROQUDRAFT_95381 [Cronartium quercuum f. sp. fusiforme G11]
MFTEADLESMGLKIPNCEGPSVGAEVGNEQRHTVGGNPDSPDDEYSAWSDGSDFQKTLFSGYEVPDSVEVEDKVNLDMVLEEFQEGSKAGEDSGSEVLDDEPATSAAPPSLGTSEATDLYPFSRKEHLAALLILGSGHNLMSRPEYNWI